MLADDPLAYWALADLTGTTAADDSGNGHAATLAGGVTLGAEGIHEGPGAAAFDGTNDSAEVPDADPLDLGGAFTIELWARPDRVDVLAGLVSKDGAGFDTTGAYNLYLGPDGKLWYETNNLSPAVVSATGAVSAGAWHHLAATFDPAASPTMRLYVDGAQVASGSPPAPTANTKKLLVGRRGVGSFFEGILDEVAIYPQALSAARIAAHHDEGRRALAPQTTTYAYDDQGNRTEVASPWGTTTYSYNPAGQLVSSSDPAGKVTIYLYDGRGNLERKIAVEGTTLYAWTSEGKLASVTK